MDISQCRSRGREALGQAAYSTKKLVLLHTGVMAGAGLAVSLLQYALSLGIGDTGGLGGLGDRAILETLQSLLQLANGLLMPFWQIGLVAAAICMVRSRNFGPGTLLEGFRHFGPVLRVNLLRWGIYLVVMILAVQVASTVFVMTPLASDLYKITEQMLETGVTDLSAVLSPEAMQALLLKMLPFMVGGVLLFLIPVAYRLRMMDYIVMDTPQLGAFYALRLSLYMTRRKCRQLFRLDLSFWWFYVLEVLAVAVCYGDLLLGLAGVQLPGSAEVWSLATYALGLLLQLGLYGWKKDLLAATYAAAYEALLPPPPQGKE